MPHRSFLELHGVLVIRSLTVIATGLFSIGTGVASAQTTGDGTPASPGHDTFVRLCSACHTPDLVKSKRLTREGWDEIIQMMIGRGATGTEAEMAEIVDYLAAAYPPKAAAAPEKQPLDEGQRPQKVCSQRSASK